MLSNSFSPKKEEFFALNTSGDATCDESFVEENNSCYEKSNHIWFGAVCCHFDAGLLCQRTRGDYYHNTPDYRHDAGGTTSLANNDNNDAPHGWRLLIGQRPASGSSCGLAL
jgi:hypothetical protein